MSQLSIDNKFFGEIEQIADALDISPEQYVLQLHEKNRALKCALFKEKGYEDFIENYQQLIDRLFYFQHDLAGDESSKEEYELISSLSEILKSTVADSFILAQIYGNLQKEKEKEKLA